MKNQFWLGIALVVGGGLLLTHTAGWYRIDFGQLLTTYWPAFLILGGLNVIREEKGEVSITGVALVLLGLFFLGRNLGFISWSIGQVSRYLLPVGLVVIGLLLMRRPGKSA